MTVGWRGMRNDLSETALPIEGMHAGAGAMHERDDDFNDSFYFRVIQSELGDRLRKQYDLTEPWPKRWSELLQQLDARAGTGRKPRAPKSTRICRR